MILALIILCILAVSTLFLFSQEKEEEYEIKVEVADDCGNGVCDEGENCKTCTDCSCFGDYGEVCEPENPESDIHGCYAENNFDSALECGDGVCEWFENCKTCPKDCEC